MFNHRREEGGRGPHLLPGPEEGGDAIHENRRIERYTDEEEADEEVYPARHNTENGGNTSFSGQNRSGPTLEVSGLVPGNENEWSSN
jgi:hypothetical protein